MNHFSFLKKASEMNKLEDSLITLLLSLYALIILFSFVIEYFPNLKTKPFALNLKLLADYSLNPVRKILPPDIPFDLSPLIVIIILVIFKSLFSILISIYSIIIIVDVVLSFIPQFRQEGWAQTLKKFADFSLDPIRKILPSDLPFDFSPMIILLILQILASL